MVAAAMDKGKKQKVEERDNEEDDELVLIALEKLHGYQEELEKINEEASEQVLAIEQKFNAIKKPVYEKRHETINTIPDFWLTAFLNHPALGDLVSDEDQKIFRYLSSLEVDDFTDVKTGYSISLVFKPNPFFEDVKLTKTFTFGDEGATKITATQIKWKEGMGLPNGVADEKKGSKRPPSDERESSFFTWFTETEFKNDLDDFQDDIAEIIKDDLWPNPLNYFNNDGEDDEFEDEEGNEAEDGSDSQEEDDDDEEDE